MGGNMDSNGHYDEFSDGSEEHAIGQQGSLCYKVAKNLAELSSCSVLWKAELQAMKLHI